jgi:hypothetical protein
LKFFPPKNIQTWLLAETELVRTRAAEERDLFLSRSKQAKQFPELFGGKKIKTHPEIVCRQTTNKTFKKNFFSKKKNITDLRSGATLNPVVESFAFFLPTSMSPSSSGSSCHV